MSINHKWFLSLVTSFSLIVLASTPIHSANNMQAVNNAQNQQVSPRETLTIVQSNEQLRQILRNHGIAEDQIEPFVTQAQNPSRFSKGGYQTESLLYYPLNCPSGWGAMALFNLAQYTSYYSDYGVTPTDTNGFWGFCSLNGGCTGVHDKVPEVNQTVLSHQVQVNMGSASYIHVWCYAP